MSWTAPFTAVSGSVFTAAQFNTFIRDNLNATAPALAQNPGAHFVTSAVNQIAERTPVQQYVSASESTTSTSYTDLTTVGPQVTCVTGVSALVGIGGVLVNSSAGQTSYMAPLISGATSSISITDDQSVSYQSPGAGGSNVRAFTTLMYAQLITPGSNTFKAQYRVTGGTGTFLNRHIWVIPF